MPHELHQVVVDELLVGQDRAAQDAALAIHMLGAGIDHHVGAICHGLLQDRCGKDVVHHHQSPGPVGQFGDRLDVDQIQGRIGRRFKKHAGRALADRGPPLRQIGAVHQIDRDAIAGQQLGQDIMAGAEQGARGDHVTAALQLAHQGGEYRCHARRGGKTGL